MAKTARGTQRQPVPSRTAPRNVGAATLNWHGLTRIDLIRLLGLGLVTVLVWCFLYNRLDASSWKTPIEYGTSAEASDAKNAIASVKAASEGHIWPMLQRSIPQLGAPFAANWSDFPSGEEFLVCALGITARILGLFPAFNFGLLAGFVLASAGFYIACRVARYNWIWSCCGALLFAFSRYAFAHGEHHIALVYYWHIPLCLLVCRWLSSRQGIGMWSRKHIFALAVAAVAGVQNVYYTNMFLQLVLLAGLFHWIRGGWRSAVPAFTVTAASALVFLLTCSDTFYYHLVHGPNLGAVVRNYQWLEFYALKVVDLVIPPPDHPLSLLGDWGRSYFPSVLVAGEIPPPCYIGLAGIAALAFLTFVSARRMLRLPARGLPLAAWQVLWVVFYSTVGGFNGFVGSLGFQLFRSTTRYSIFIVPMVLLFAVHRLSIFTRLRQRPTCKGDRATGLVLTAIAATLVTIIGIWDQTPPQVSAGDIAATAGIVEADRQFTEKMEARLRPGAMIFQLPIMEYPESPARGVSAYDHFRPYFFSKALRYSFGNIKGRPRDAWQQQLASKGPQQAISTLESFGFAAIYINRSGFQDRGAALLDQFKSAGYSDLIENSLGDLVCLFIKPSENPVLPLIRTSAY